MELDSGRKFKSYKGFYLCIVTSLGIPICTYYNCIVTKFGDHITVEVVYLTVNIMSYKERQYYVYLKSNLWRILSLDRSIGGMCCTISTRGRNAHMNTYQIHYEVT